MNAQSNCKASPQFSREIRNILSGLSRLPKKKRNFIIGDMLRHGGEGQRRVVGLYVRTVLSLS